MHGASGVVNADFRSAAMLLSDRATALGAFFVGSFFRYFVQQTAGAGR
jgi:hypothetical protein